MIKSIFEKVKDHPIDVIGLIVNRSTGGDGPWPP